MSVNKVMKPKHYKELIDKLTDKVLEQEGIEIDSKYLIRNKPRFEKIKPWENEGYRKYGKRPTPNREYLVHFQPTKLMWDLPNGEQMKVYSKSFPFLNPSGDCMKWKNQTYKFNFTKDVDVEFWVEQGTIYGILFSFDVRKEEVE